MRKWWIRGSKVVDSKGKVVLDGVEGKTVLGKTVSCVYGLYFNSYYLRRSCFKIGCSPFIEKSTRYFRNLQMLEVCDPTFHWQWWACVLWSLSSCPPSILHCSSRFGLYTKILLLVALSLYFFWQCYSCQECSACLVHYPYSMC